MLFEILFTGEHTNTEHPGYTEMNPFTSAVALVSDGKDHVLLDTGSFSWQPILLSKLAENGLTPNDITHVCLTHFHLDHTANTILFKNAKIIASRSIGDNKTGSRILYHDPASLKLPCGIRILETPGHTDEHAAYLIDFAGKTYCFAGDAINPEIYKTLKAPSYFSPSRQKKYLESVEKILNSADIIIPGHHEIITNEKRGIKLV